jgi:hypothetical protein
MPGLSQGPTADKYRTLGPKTTNATRKVALPEPDGLKENCPTVCFSIECAEHELIRWEKCTCFDTLSVT